MKLTGFHGTTAKNANSILNTSFKPSRGNCWLGQGVYFFEDLENVFDGKRNARWWCRCCKKLESYTILKASISSDNILDMINSGDDQKKFDNLFVLLYDKHLSAGNSPESFTPSVVYSILGKNVDVIRSIVDAKNYTNLIRTYATIYPQSQICVCNNIKKVISNVTKEEEFND